MPWIAALARWWRRAPPPASDPPPSWDEFVDYVSAVMAVECPALGRVPVDLVASAIEDQCGRTLEWQHVSAALAALARRNGAAFAPVGTSVS